VVPKGSVQIKAASDPKYQAGDVWEYETRRGEESSHFVVVKLENSPNLGMIVHVGVADLILKNCQGNALDQHVPHLPFARRALDASAIRRVGRNRQLPDYEEGYEIWRQAFLEDHAGGIQFRLRTPSPLLRRLGELGWVVAAAFAKLAQSAEDKT